ncbi:MAG: hypothetical protein I3270_00190 [Candidatus Moeniiplasma glomeromycotorum]|nr:hypothetical protein [Candidatus Moeniiplasma glomeromycotorum]MCE8166064.1 hypothetical protein [Candidatus Moeniiplasma glomeromycotorum]
MAGKITTAEFQDWAQKLSQLTKEIVISNPQTGEEWIQSQGLNNFYAKNEILFAVFSSILNLVNATGEEGINKPLITLNSLTLLQWIEKVGQRIKEHCIAEGYYKPDQSPDLTALKERTNVMLDKLMDIKYLNRLLNYANPEEYKSITNYAVYLREWEKLVPGSIEKSKKVPLNQNSGISMIVDMIERVEKLDNLLKRAEKPRPSTPTTPNSPPPVPSANSNYTNNLENEIADFKNQIKQLEDKIKDNSSPVNPAEKEVYQKLLEDIRKRLGDKEKEFQKIQKSEQKPKNNNLPLIIGVSAVAIVFLLIIIIITLARPSRRHD